MTLYFKTKAGKYMYCINITCNEDVYSGRGGVLKIAVISDFAGLRQYLTVISEDFLQLNSLADCKVMSTTVV